MKKIFFALPMILMLFIAACGAEDSPSREGRSPREEAAVPTHSPQFSIPIIAENADISFHIRTNPINILTSWLDFDIINHSAGEYIYGEELALYRFENHQWEYIETLSEVVWHDIGIILMPFSVNSGSIDLEYLFGRLDEGEYRVEKDVFAENGDAHLITVEFEVEELEK